ncbi:hypothetical protein M3O75_26445 [Klebsiella pneumoniae]|nr:hypothetical protein [Klebsiella pneumoniae]
MDLRDLKTFLHLAESRHFAAARGPCTSARRRFRARSNVWKRTSASRCSCEIIAR